MRSADPAALPILDPSYLEQTEHDLEELRASYAAIQEVVSQKAFERYLGAPLEPRVMPKARGEIDELIRNMCGSGFHLCGTCKMGKASDPTAVVDPQLRVRGLEATRSGRFHHALDHLGQSQLPSMMIGERASDLIRGMGMLQPENTPFHRHQVH
ncbi:MAG: GMC oxidoreductase [Hyphomicrobiaceae bacterium]